MLSRLLAHPATRGLDLDSPQTTAIRREIVRGKPFLRKIYEEWYRLIAERVPKPVTGGSVDTATTVAGTTAASGRDDEDTMADAALELGSGAGFLDEFVPRLVTSDVFAVPGVARVIDARELPFRDASLRAIAMTNVFHHIPQVERFLDEAQRCLRPGGRLVMIEPWVTWWSRVVYTRLHHEPFDPAAPDWSFPATGPLSGANGALPWIVFSRDRDRLSRGFPRLRVLEARPIMPLRYLVSGGISMRALQPGWLHGAWAGLERLGGPLTRASGMFAIVVVERAPG
ncbi:MAG: methyltransferase domain-containing protein [Phycisphaerales bacterium]